MRFFLLQNLDDARFPSADLVLCGGSSEERERRRRRSRKMTRIEFYAPLWRRMGDACEFSERRENYV